MPVQTSRECESEAANLRSYCDRKFPVGLGTPARLSPTGETYTELALKWEDGCLTAVGARDAAQKHFDDYAAGKTGTLYWRVTPEIAFDPHRKKYAYYMRLLISDKPRKD